MTAHLTPDALRLVPELQRYARQKSSGELTVKTEQNVAKLAFSHGKLAWVYFIDDQEKLVDVLIRRKSLTPQVAMSAYRESQERGKPFGDVLVQWGLLTEQALQEILTVYIRDRLGRLLNMRQVDWLFVPRRVDMGTGPTFDLGYMLETLKNGPTLNHLDDHTVQVQLPKARTSQHDSFDMWDIDEDTTLSSPQFDESGVTPHPQQDIHTQQVELRGQMVLQGFKTLGGLVNAVIVDLNSRMCLEHLVGSEASIDVVAESFTEVSRFALAAERIADLGERLDEILLTLKTRFHLIRIVPSQRIAVCLVLDRTAADLGVARLALMLAVEGITAEQP